MTYVAEAVNCLLDIRSRIELLGEYIEQLAVDPEGRTYIRILAEMSEEAVVYGRRLQAEAAK